MKIGKGFEHSVMVYAEVETLVDGALEYKKVLSSTYEKYAKIVRSSEDDD